MGNAGFYIFAVFAIVIAALIMRQVMGCLMRGIVVAVLLIVLATAYYLFIGQYDPELKQSIENFLNPQ